jgi:hypothetical protein
VHLLDLILSDTVLNSDNGKTKKLNLHLRSRLGDSTSTSEHIKAIPYDLYAISQSIQNIARAAAPIGAVMDYLPTEVQSMLKERDFWRDECEQYDNKLGKERKKTDDELESLRTEISLIEYKIERMVDIIFKKRSKVVENDKWIHNQMNRICGIQQHGQKLILH